MLNTVLKMEDISKRFPGVVALKHATVDLAEGEVHAIIGENGAGKSTLVKIMTGVMQPSDGRIFLDGEEIQWHNAYHAIQRGVVAIYQEPATFPDLNVAENIFLRHQPVRGLWRRIDWKKVYRRTQELLDELSASIRPTDKIQGLSFAESQLVEIAKALSVNARIVIMDEPTSALSMAESDRLFEVVQQLKARGTSVVFISHRLDDIFRVADRVTTLRDGEVIGTRATSEVDRPELIRMMVGRSVSDLFPKTPATIGDEVLSVEGMSKKGQFRDVAFSVRQGEILGLYGLIGAGRTEVLKAVFGLNRPDSGQIRLEGKPVSIAGPSDAIRRGIAYLSENRDTEGLILEFSIAKNVTLADLSEYANGPWMHTEKEDSTGRQQLESLQIKAVDEQQLAVSLSGGNKQKVSLAKWLVRESKLLILDEPTKGIDVAAKAAVHKLIDDLSNRGIAIIMISSELPEILGMSDTILVMHDGRVKGSFRAEDADEEKILAMALTEAAAEVGA
jgi:rhamnose transport system ATP-binding protein